MSPRRDLWHGKTQMQNYIDWTRTGLGAPVINVLGLTRSNGGRLLIDWTSEGESYTLRWQGIYIIRTCMIVFALCPTLCDIVFELWAIWSGILWIAHQKWHREKICCMFTPLHLKFIKYNVYKVFQLRVKSFCGWFLRKVNSYRSSNMEEKSK